MGVHSGQGGRTTWESNKWLSGHHDEGFPLIYQASHCREAELSGDTESLTLPLSSRAGGSPDTGIVCQQRASQVIIPIKD